MGTSDVLSSDYIGAYLKQLRENRNRTREDVAAAVGVSESAITQYERGKSIPILAFIRICVFLGYDPAKVIGDILTDNNIYPLKG